MTAIRRQVELLEKNRPRQERAKRTYEGILNAAAELLLEVGVERISTNLIAERAGITVPALYRYFPNKYSVLHALGALLMDRQNAVFSDWFEEQGAEGKPEVLLDNIFDVLKLTHSVTLEQTAGLEISQSLRAVAPLQQVRLESHNLVSRQFAEAAAGILQCPVNEALLLRARVSVEVGYSVVEMALEEDPSAADAILHQGAHMIRLYWLDILGTHS
jgi:AcrR family transcriptional regulator